MEILKRIGNNVLTRVLVIAFVVSFLLFFFENVQTTYNSYTDLEKEIENNKIQKQIIETQIEEWSRQISDLDNPDKLEIVLRERGYGKEGEILYVYDIPEPVTPIEEVINNDRSKSVFEYVVEFIVGQEGG
mgnify:FL=1|tara:strand:- start:561 stop:953 length:393 start_codon:yes stop_codon:yes gene_type:complete